MPLVDKPFEHIALDIVGSLPRSKAAGSKYILAICDYAIRYHEVVHLVERFVSTLKAMLRKLTSRLNQKNWYEILPYHLFAYQEVSQESTGPPPPHLSSSMDTELEAHWISSKRFGQERRWNVSVAAHVIQTRDRLQEMSSIARENLLKAQIKQKIYYDEQAKPQALEVGDKVVVLASTKL
jgi:hypothetical protein